MASRGCQGQVAAVILRDPGNHDIAIKLSKNETAIAEDTTTCTLCAAFSLEKRCDAVFADEQTGEEILVVFFPNEELHLPR